MHVTIDNLVFEYRNASETRTIFKGASATFSPGQFYALMGPSGSGKTTLFRLLTRDLEPTQGQILIGAQSLPSVPVNTLRSSVFGRIFQDYVLVPFLTPVENLLLAREIAVGHAGADDRQRAAQLLERVGLEGYSDRTVDSLSGGEQQRVAIARSLMGSASILLADEPTGALDKENTDHIAQLLASLAHEEKMIVIAGTHDQAFANHTDSVMRIRDHRLVTE